jgi:hypothetical protein
MAVTTKWQLVSGENIEAYHAAINTPEDYKVKLRALFGEVKAGKSDAYIEELTVDKAAGKVQRVVYIHGEKKRDSGLIDINTEKEHTLPDGRSCKGKITVEGEGKLIIHEKGADFESTVALVRSGDELTATLTSGTGVVATQKFKKV